MIYIMSIFKRNYEKKNMLQGSKNICIFKIDSRINIMLLTASNCMQKPDKCNLSPSIETQK